MERRHLRFYGRVQGVGFRFRAGNAARALGLTGWVRNEYEGTVEMELQGDAASIDRVLRTLAMDRYINIEHVESRAIPVEPNEKRFRTEY